MSPSRSFPIPHRRRHLVAFMLAAIAVAAGIGWAMSSRRQPPPAAPEAPAPTALQADTIRFAAQAPQLAMLKVVRAQAGPMPVGEPLAARLVYDEDHTVRLLPPFAGRIVALKAAPGDRVAAGQALAEIDSPDFGSAAADVGKAQADLEVKRQGLARSSELLQAEVIARKEYEQARADEAQARAEAERAQLRLRNMLPGGGRVVGQRAPLVSPIAGVVAERTANPGMEVGAGLAVPLFVVTDPRHLWLLIDLPESLLSQVQIGAQAQVQVQAWPGETFSARVVQIGAVVDAATRRIPVRAVIDNADMKLRPEMFARVILPRAATAGQPAQAVEVPNTALVNDGLYTAVFIEAAPHEFRKVRVEVAVKGAESSFVSSGLKEGDLLVTQGALLLAAELRGDESTQERKP